MTCTFVELCGGPSSCGVLDMHHRHRPQNFELTKTAYPATEIAAGGFPHYCEDDFVLVCVVGASPQTRTWAALQGTACMKCQFGPVLAVCAVCCRAAHIDQLVKPGLNAFWAVPQDRFLVGRWQSGSLWTMEQRHCEASQLRVPLWYVNVWGDCECLNVGMCGN